MTDIFISYARSTEAQAKQIASALRALGYGVWRDDELPAHRAYAEVIEERLKAARAVVVVWSAEAVKSQWVRAEADLAREAGTLVQLSVDGSIPPLPFNQIQCADLSGWAGEDNAPGWRKVVASVADLLGGRASGAVAAGETLPALPSKPSIAVLSLADLSPARDQDYFCDGMVEEIVTALSRFPSLFVIGAGSGLSYRGSAQSSGEIARTLGVRYLLGGSVRRAGERVRIAVNLTDAVDNVPVWSERFDGTLEDVFALQDEVAHGVAGQIEPAINAAETRRASARPTGDQGAYDLFLRALQMQKHYEPESFRQALDLLDQAIARDASYARAVALAGYIHALSYTFGYSNDLDRTREQALALVHRALRLAPDDPDVLACVAHSLSNTHEDLDGAEVLAERALVINPGSSFAWYVSGWVKAYSGRATPALEHFKAALRLDPRMPERHSALIGIGLSLVMMRRFDEAIPPLREATRLSPGNLGGLFGLAAALAHTGAMAEARAAYQALPNSWLAHPNRHNGHLLLAKWEVIYEGIALVSDAGGGLA